MAKPVSNHRANPRETLPGESSPEKKLAFIGFRADEELKQESERQAKRWHVDASEILREALGRFLDELRRLEPTAGELPRRAERGQLKLL